MHLLVAVTFWRAGTGNCARGRNEKPSQWLADWSQYLYPDGNKGRPAVVAGDSQTGAPQTGALPGILEREGGKEAGVRTPTVLSSTSFPRRRVK